MTPTPSRSGLLDIPTPEERSASVIESVAASIRELNESLSSSLSSASSSSYKSKSVALWGSAASPTDGDWESFFLSRVATPVPLPSPMALMQERYAGSGWHLLCACVLMTRVSSHETKERCIGAFFDLCPTPTALADADPGALASAIHSLGFQAERARGLAEITEAWLSMPRFEIDLVPKAKGGNKLYMAGPFVVDSWNLFFKGDQSYEMASSIADVVHFQRWMKKQEKAIAVKTEIKSPAKPKKERVIVKEEM